MSRALRSLFSSKVSWAAPSTADATLPYRKSSNGSFSDYEPLTDEDKASMSESAIKAYEEKAKQGLLFNDRNLSDRVHNLVGVGGTLEGDGFALLRLEGAFERNAR